MWTKARQERLPQGKARGQKGEVVPGQAEAIRQSCRSSEKGSRVQAQGPPRTCLVERLSQGWGWGMRNGDHTTPPSGREAWSRFR